MSTSVWFIGFSVLIGISAFVVHENYNCVNCMAAQTIDSVELTSSPIDDDGGGCCDKGCSTAKNVDVTDSHEGLTCALEGDDLARRKETTRSQFIDRAAVTIEPDGPLRFEISGRPGSKELLDRMIKVRETKVSATVLN